MATPTNINVIFMIVATWYGRRFTLYQRDKMLAGGRAPARAHFNFYKHAMQIIHLVGNNF